MSKPKTMPDTTRQAQRDAEARARQVPLPHGLDPNTVGATAALFVGQYRKTHRTGPTWREVAEHLHPDCASTCGPHTDRAEKVVPRVHSEQLIRQLIRAGWLEATREPRSLTLAGAGAKNGGGQSTSKRAGR